jgi:inner membrane protein
VDNLTHTLAGVLLAEAVVQLRSRRNARISTSWRDTAYLVAAITSNLPDLDFVYAGVTGRPLGYLLHHRGHSHTIVVALGLALLTFAVVAAMARRSKAAWSRLDTSSILALCALGPLVHIAMDFTNNYGVHPFWPFYNGWVYGDAVFIVEPFFWAVTIPPLIFAARTRAARFILATVLALGVGLSWVVPFVPWAVALSVTVLALVAMIASRWASPAFRVGLAAVASLGIVGVFFAGSMTAKGIARRSAGIGDAVVADIVVTPFPANPLCYSVLVVATRGGDYVVKRATVATMPTWMSSEQCPIDTADQPTAHIVPVDVPPRPEIRYRGEFIAPLSELVLLAHENCQASALMRFARVPYWVSSGKDQYIVGDLRYDRRPGLDFSDVLVPAHPPSCPRAVPPWLPPRSSLLAME